MLLHKTADFKADFLSENIKRRHEQTKYVHQRFIRPKPITDRKILRVESCVLSFPLKKFTDLTNFNLTRLASPLTSFSASELNN